MTATKTDPVQDPTTDPAAEEKLIPQWKVDKLLAAERRTAERKVVENQGALQELRTQVEELLSGRPIEEVRAEMETTAAKLRTAQETAKMQEAAFTNQIKTLSDKASGFERRFIESTRDRALVDAAIPKAVSLAAANLIKLTLQNASKVDETGQVQVEINAEENGIPIKRFVTPQEAVALM